MSPTARRHAPTPQCPVRPGDPCSLCQPGVTGPQDCGLVYLVMDDPELREELAGHRRKVAHRRSVPGPPFRG